MNHFVGLRSIVLRVAVLPSLIAGFAVQDAFAEGEAQPSVMAIRTETAPKIDGRLNEDVWQTAGLVDGLHQKIPVAYGVASERTEIRVLYDENFLYFGIHAAESNGEKIIASTMVRDGDMSSDDRITISLDTYSDSRNGFQFEINPLGNKRDGLIENGSESYEWDGIWYADARVDGTGYVIEVAIPFKTLSIAKDKKSWGLQIVRFTKRNGEEDRWSSPTPEIEPFNLSGAGRLEGLEGIHQGIGLDVVPKLALRHTDDGETGDTDTDFDPGIDAFYRITPSLTSSLTVNTDFGEAEVDTRQIQLSRFPLFFPEKRQFFLQDAGIFDFGGLQRNPLPFFSRRIGLSNVADGSQEIPIIAGTKVTGRVGKFNVGLIDVVTDKYRRTDGEKISVRNLAVARVSANVLDESTVGMVATSGNPNSKNENFVVGADVNYRNSQFLDQRRTVVARAWFQHSKTSGVDSEQVAWGTRLTYPNDRVNWYLIVEGVQENFNPALGFTRRPGVRSYFAGYRFRDRPETWIRTWDKRVTGSLVTRSSNRFASAEVTFEPVTIANPAGDMLTVTYARRFEDLIEAFLLRPGVVVPRGSFSWDRYTVDMSTTDGRPISAGVLVTRSGLWGGNQWEFTPRLAWRPSRYLVVGVNYTRNDVSVSGGDFVVHLVGFKTDIQFTPDLSWNTFVQFDSESDSIGINTRLRWIISPGRELFAVLNQGLVVEDGNVERGETEPRVKLGWTFRF